jgi:hypothetical protein
VNEQEWLACTDPAVMLDFLRGKTSERKLRLLAVSCYRLIWRWMTDPSNRAVLEVAERFADSLASPGELADAYATACNTYLNSYINSIFAYAAAHEDAAHAADVAVRDVVSVQGVGELAAQVREIMPNPFHPLPFVDKPLLLWNDGIIPRLARQIYHDQRLPTGTLDGERLAILADALEDAGCTDAELLGHLRRSGPHVRGCWALDLFLDAMLDGAAAGRENQQPNPPPLLRAAHDNFS